MNESIISNMQRHNTVLGKYATKDEEAVYLKTVKKDIRPPYFHDADKIIYSLSYIRYMKKCQVFANRDNDHLQSRMLHVQYVSKIARTIGRALGLNEDLIEAAALGHDLGHTPYGHEGERILNRISMELGEGNFYHNINSVRNLMFVENYGKGHNVSVQVLDAIMCHNGELVSNEYYPKKKSSDDFLKEYYGAYSDPETAKYLRPMTLEGCVVRISDIIAYLGRDIEDGVRKGLVSFEDIPKEITSVLGTNNSDIVETIINDIIKNSIDLPYLKMSDDVFKAISALKKFNYEHIYSKSLTDKGKKELETKFRTLITKYISDIKNNNSKSTIIGSYLAKMSEEYRENSPERIAIDYISGMTDDFFDEQYLNINNK
ncbi:MAG: HD domain-containing protein [Bacilli bacterium]|nr:HD domain-containing protein [Bacilli bacterium]